MKPNREHERECEQNGNRTRTEQIQNGYRMDTEWEWNGYIMGTAYRTGSGTHAEWKQNVF